jgi:hypothetical protein
VYDHPIARCDHLREFIRGIPDEHHTAPSRFGVVLFAETIGHDVLVQHADAARRIEQLDADGVLHRVGAAYARAILRHAVWHDALDHHDVFERGDLLRMMDDQLFEFALRSRAAIE